MVVVNDAEFVQELLGLVVVHGFVMMPFSPLEKHCNE